VIVAAVAGKLHITVRVAYLAGNLSLVPMVKWESMLVQCCWGPGMRCMAVLALDAKKAGMDLGLRMALHTLRCRPDEFLLTVALLALQLGMATVQREEAGMVEIAHPVSTVMALQAIRTQLRQVFLDENHAAVCSGVTGDTGLQINVFQILAVAAGTGNRLVAVICLMANQTETCSCVIKISAIQLCRQPCGGCVALRACRVKQRPVDLRLVMALSALCGWV